MLNPDTEDIRAIGIIFRQVFDKPEAFHNV
jgi:hypothetical protein